MEYSQRGDRSGVEVKAAIGGSKHASSFIVASLARNAVRLTALACPACVAQHVLFM